MTNNLPTMNTFLSRWKLKITSSVKIWGTETQEAKKVYPLVPFEIFTMFMCYLLKKHF